MQVSGFLVSILMTLSHYAMAVYHLCCCTLLSALCALWLSMSPCLSMLLEMV